MEKELKVIGKAKQDYTGFRKVTGTAKYSNDFSFTDMLHAKSLRSPYAHANILSIDTTEAEKLEGVRLVMSHKNFPDLFFESVHYWGMDVACVIAQTTEIASEAVKLIKVEYEELPFVINGKDAMKEGAPQAMPDRPNVVPFAEHKYFTQKNEKGLYQLRIPGEFDGFGDVEKGRKECDVIVEDSGFAYSFARAPLMKPTTCRANYADGYLTIHIDNQEASVVRYNLSQRFGIPASKIRIFSEINACSFGARAGGATEEVLNGASCTLLACAAAIHLGQPVAFDYTVDEDQRYHWGRGTFDSRYAIGFKRDGTMVMMEGEVYRNTCTGESNGEATQGDDINATGNMLYSHNCRHNKHVKHRVYTNSPGWAGWQAYGNPEVFLPVISVMDEAAEELGMDPVDLHKMNVCRKGDNFLSATYAFGGAQYLSKDGMIPSIEAGVKHTDWYARRQKPEEKTGRIRHGIGMSPALMQTAGQNVASQAIVMLNSDGSALLCCNMQDIGQGAHSAQVQIVAEVFDIPYENVKMRAGDTDTLYTSFQIASSGTITQGRATYNAAMDAKTKLIKKAAEVLNVAENTLDMKNGRVVSLVDPDMEIPWIAPAQKSNIPGITYDYEIDWMTNLPMDVVGYGSSHVGPGAAPAELGATFVELDVDTETGEIFNVKMFHAQDCGKAINPKTVEGNYLGLHHGLEAMTGAEQIIDPKTGKLLNDNWYDFAMSTALDSDVEVEIIETYDVTHPFGACGCGQAIMNGLPGAFANALYNAIGVRLKETPFTPAKILKALAEKEASKS